MKSFLQAPILTFSVIILLAGPLWGQGGVTSSGTEYWLGFMPNGAGAGNSSVYEDLFIASGTDNTVTISGGVATKRIEMKAGQIYDYYCPNFMNSTDEVPQTDAIHITSTSPITVYGYSSWGNVQGAGDSPDGYLGLPLEDFGTEYYTVNFPDNYVFGQMPGEFLIISPYDNTVVTITPAAETKSGRPAGVPWKDTLQKGQTLLVQSPGTDPGNNDLTGTLIKSTKPIGVLTGHQITSVPSDCGCYSADNLIEMVPSVDKWGTQYFDMPMAGRPIAGDYIRILSAEHGNTIAYGNTSVTLDSGQYADVPQVTQPTVFTSINHKRFIVAQYSYSQGMYGDPGYSDPWMVLFTPQEQFEKEMIFRAPTSTRGTFTNYVTFIAEEDSISKITINGITIDSFPQVGTAVFSGTNPLIGARRILIAAQPMKYIAKSPVPFGAYQYGFSNYEGYGWPVGMMQDMASSDTGSPIVKPLDSTSSGTYGLRITEVSSKLASVAMIVDSGDPRWPHPSYNYSFQDDTDFVVGDSTYRATLNVINPSLDAYAAIYALDRAGKGAVFEYRYSAPKVASFPSGGDFGRVLRGTDSCMLFSIYNAGTRILTVDSMKFLGTPAESSFTVNPTAITFLAPDSAAKLTICYSPQDTGILTIDTLAIYFEQASTVVFPLRGIGYELAPESVAPVATNLNIIVSLNSGNLNVSLTASTEDRTLSISDLLGRTIAKINIPAGAVGIDAPITLGKGIYFARVGPAVRKFEVTE